MDKKTPKVSIIMGIYNCESTLEDSIKSIINQSYENWELIMCDDCSSDKTLMIAKNYEKKYPNRIKVIKNEANLTLGPTLNRCLKLTTGEFIARQDGDDLSDKTRFKRQVEFLISNNDYDMVGSWMTSFDKNGKLGIQKLKDEPNVRDLVTHCTTFAHATIMIRSEVMKKLNGYNENKYAKQLEDYELWSRFFFDNRKGYNIQESLYYVREDREAYKRKNIKRRLRSINMRFVTNKMLNIPINLYVYILKDVVALVIPSFIFRKYYKWRLGN
jgi:glycosyltransferase EpsE